MKKKLAYLIASAFGVGFCPKASGTAGSLVTLPLAFVLAYYWGACGILLGAVIAFFAGVIASKEVLKYTKHDPSLIVVDEVAGQLTSFILVAPLLQRNSSWVAMAIYIAGFGLFRLFDITKPSIVGWADKKIENAWGVMLDDIFAGLFAAIILFGIIQFL
ncbi:MAG: phosphatidylglycerophosphatase A [Alphaproteobacteria bacterium]|nr:phosphatidylglycerophosphatase A [Alphaproteobacteria bacterium]